MAQLKIVPDKPAMSESAAERITWLVEAAIAARGVAAVSLTGGTTPDLLYQLLADPNRPWRNRIDMSAQETIIWEGSPSQVTNLGVYVLCALLFFLVVPILYAIWRWIVTRCLRYSVTDQRVRVTEGVFNKRTDSLELYRVKDVVLLEPFGLRLFGLGNIELRTSDLNTPLLVLRAVPTPHV